MTYLSEQQLEAIAQVTCPRCGALPYRPCGAQLGNEVGRRAPHKERVELALEHQRDLAKLRSWNRQ